MIFKAKYKIDSNTSKYYCIQNFLHYFHNLNNGYDDFDDCKEFFGFCEKGEFSFKTNTPASIFYAYLPKTKITIGEENSKAVVKVKTSANMLLFVFVILIFSALLFVMETLLINDMYLLIGFALSLLCAFLTAFLSARQLIKIKKILCKICTDKRM